MEGARGAEGLLWAGLVEHPPALRLRPPNWPSKPGEPPLVILQLFATAWMQPAPVSFG